MQSQLLTDTHPQTKKKKKRKSSCLATAKADRLAHIQSVYKAETMDIRTIVQTRYLS